MGFAPHQQARPFCRAAQRRAAQTKAIDQPLLGFTGRFERGLPVAQRNDPVDDEQDQDHPGQKDRRTVRHYLIKDSPKVFPKAFRHRVSPGLQHALHHRCADIVAKRPHLLGGEQGSVNC